MLVEGHAYYQKQTLLIPAQHQLAQLRVQWHPLEWHPLAQPGCSLAPPGRSLAQHYLSKLQRPYAQPGVAFRAQRCLPRHQFPQRCLP